MTSDIRYALRMIARNRLFAAVIVCVLGIGIGANTAIFSVVDALLLRPLPFPGANRLAFVWETSPRSTTRIGPSGPNYLDYKEQSGSFESMAALELGSGTVTGFGEPQQVPALRVTTNYLRVLGINPALGRDFNESEAWRDRVVIISYGFWERNLGRAADAIGRRLMIDDLQYTVIGVTPRTFWSPLPSELLVPWGDGDLRARSRTGHDFGVIGRLTPDATPDQAAVELTGIERRIATIAPQMRDWAVTVVPLRRLVAENLGASAMVLLGAVGVVLVVACANIASLLLARATSCERDIAVRRALGANRRHLAQQFLAESLALSLLGGIAGLLLAMWGTDILDNVLPQTLPVTDGGVIVRPPILLDGIVASFTACVSIATGLAFGLTPALASGRTDLTASLKESRSTHGQTRWRSLLIVTEISLALVLVICAVLTVESFWRLAHVDPGFAPDRLLALEMELPTDARYTDAVQQRTFFSRVLERAGSLPGVQRAALATILPLDPTLAHGQTFDIPNAPALSPGEPPRSAARRSVTPDYFQTMGIPLRSGRTFTDADREGRPYVTIIDDTFVRSYFERANPVGQRLRIGRTDLEIIGTVGAVKQNALDRAPLPTMYLSMRQVPEPLMSLVVRTAADPVAMIPTVKRAVYAIDPDQPVYRIRTMEQALHDITSPQRVTLILLTLFAATALLLASIGIYGLIAFVVARRTREIGIRIALGAARQQVLRLVIGEALGVTLAGLVAGVALAMIASRILASILYGVDVREPIVFLGTAAGIAMVAALASYLPARRATAINPLVALRTE